MNGTLELHPLCTLFPRMSGAEFDSLKFDILANGLQEPIVVHDGFILDGGNRYAACTAAGVEPVLKNFTGASPATFVLSANLHRRHLTPGQQAAIVASAQDWASAQPAHRPEKGGNVAGLSTVADRAARSGASERTQRMADKVAKADPELAKQVGHGIITLPKALEQIAPSPRPFDPAPFAAPLQQSPAALLTQALDDLEEGDIPDLEEANRGLEAENEILREKVRTLEQRVRELGATDQGARIEQMTQEMAGLRSLAETYSRDLAKSSQTATKLERYTKLLAQLRDAAGVEHNRDIVKHVVREAHHG